MGVVVAVASGWLTSDVRVERGQLWADDDPVVLGKPDAFRELDAVEAESLIHRSGPAPVRAAVEDASAAPGELRHVAPAPARRASR